MIAMPKSLERSAVTAQVLWKRCHDRWGET